MLEIQTEESDMQVHKWKRHGGIIFFIGQAVNVDVIQLAAFDHVSLATNVSSRKDDQLFCQQLVWLIFLFPAHQSQTKKIHRKTFRRIHLWNIKHETNDLKQ